MSLRFRLLILGFLGLIAVAAYTFPLWAPYVIEVQVDQSFPIAGLATDLQPAFEALPFDQRDAYLEMYAQDPAMTLDMVTAALSPGTAVDPTAGAMPAMADQAAVLNRGEFVVIDAVHAASGSAAIYRMPDDTVLVRLENFQVTNGPDLHVVLTRNQNPRTAEEVGGDYLDLGLLQGNSGSQNYNVPPGIDVTQYGAVVIYCVRYGVVFSVASVVGG